MIARNHIYLLTVHLFMCQIMKTEGNDPKIGIIGGGMGGTSTAYFLHELLGDIDIDLYEFNNIGGRLSTSKIFKQEYEMGGSILHPKNYYAKEFVTKFGLEANSGCDEHLGIFDGRKYSFIESKYSLINLAKLVWHYGLDAYWLQRGNEKSLDSFSKIYKLQSEGIAFKTVSDLLAAMNPEFVHLLQKTTRDYYTEEEGLHDPIVDELVTAINRANYGQLTDIPAFVGLVSVAGASPDLWSVFGGNKRIPEELLKESGAERLNKQVTEIAQLEGGKFRVYSQIDDKNADLSEGESNRSDKEYVDYDAVVIATPMTSDKATLKLVNFTKTFEFLGSFQKIICSLIEGHLNETTFGNYVNAVLTFNPHLAYNSVGRQSPINLRNKEECTDKTELSAVYKVFSPERLTESQLNHLFESYDKIEVVDWLAYPHYTTQNIMTDDFELVPGLYYINAIEKAASAIEMSAIGAKNVALLISNFLNHEKSHKGESMKDEL